MAVTQKDIADQLGVTQQLVGLALNGRPGVAHGTRRRIEQAARALGYSAQSNSQAREMAARRHGKRSRTEIVSVMLARNISLSSHDDPFVQPILSGMASQAERHGLIFAISMWGPTGPLPHAIANKRVDGVIVISQGQSAVDQVHEAGLSVVTVFTRGASVPTIAIADYEGSALAAEHLVELGHTRIAYLGQRLNSPGQIDRFQAYKNVLGRHGIAIREDLLELSIDHPMKVDGADGMARLLSRSRDFSAVLCYNDTIAMGAVDALHEAGLSVPADISVAGFDNISDEFRFTPAITSIGFDRRAVGQLAIDLLRREIDFDFAAAGAIVRPPMETTIPVELIVRESTANAKY